MKIRTIGHIFFPFFDCTNYYFEIDLPCEDKQKGPSKENQHTPIIGQALLLDADLVPLAMQMFPGNESEKPLIRKTIEESYLDARPVYVQKRETIYGHFLICYLSLFLLRVMEVKCFKNQVNAYDLIHFMRDFRVVHRGDGTYVNISRNQAVNDKVKKVTGLTNLDALYLSKTEIDNLFKNSMLIDV